MQEDIICQLYSRALQKPRLGSAMISVFGLAYFLVYSKLSDGCGFWSNNVSDVTKQDLAACYTLHQCWMVFHFLNYKL